MGDLSLLVSQLVTVLSRGCCWPSAQSEISVLCKWLIRGCRNFDTSRDFETSADTTLILFGCVVVYSAGDHDGVKEVLCAK